MKIPLARPEIYESDIDAVVAVLRSTSLSQGPALRQFEEALARYLDVPEAIAVNSGTSALQVALRALNIGEGDEVLLPSFSFMAVTNAILSEKAVPVFVDIEPESCNIDPSALEPLMSEKTKAIIIVHSFGMPARAAELIAFGRRNGLVSIEDAGEALGSEICGCKCGTLADVGVYAFYPNKLITTGEGGAVVTRSPALAQRIRSLRNQGRCPSDEWFQHWVPGFSYRIAEMNCALGLQQLSRIEKILLRREALATHYGLCLRENSELHPLIWAMQESRIAWFTYPVLLNQYFKRRDRDELWTELKKDGIESARYFAPAHLQPALQGVPFRCGDLSRTVSISDRVLCLPLFNSMRETEIELVCNSIHEIMTAKSSVALHAATT